MEKWALRHWGRVPHTGEKMEIDGFQLIATEVTLRRIRRLRVVRKPEPKPADPDAEATEEQASS